MDDILDYVDEKYKINEKSKLENSNDIYGVNKQKKNNKNDNNTIKYINKSFSFIVLTLFLLIIYIGFSAFNIQFKCENFIYFSYIYIILSILIYTFFILFIIQFLSYQTKFKNFMNYYRNYYIFVIIIILILFYFIGILFKNYEHDVIYSHILWIILLFLISILFLPFYINIDQVKILISYIIKQIICVIIILFILYYNNYNFENINNNQIIILTIILILLSSGINQMIIKESSDEYDNKLIISYILLIWFVYNILSNTNSIIENTNMYCNQALNICSNNDNDICRYYPNYCKLSVESILSNIDLIRKN